jgi:hypothetical protein
MHAHVQSISGKLASFESSLRLCAAYFHNKTLKAVHVAARRYEGRRRRQGSQIFLEQFGQIWRGIYQYASDSHRRNKDLAFLFTTWAWLARHGSLLQVQLVLEQKVDFGFDQRKQWSSPAWRFLKYPLARSTLDPATSTVGRLATTRTATTTSDRPRLRLASTIRSVHTDVDCKKKGTRSLTREVPNRGASSVRPYFRIPLKAQRLSWPFGATYMPALVRKQEHLTLPGSMRFLHHFDIIP